MNDNVALRHCFYYQRCAGRHNQVSDKVLNRMVDRAMLDRFRSECSRGQKIIPKLKSTEPRCFAPHVDVTRARQAYGKWALPKLVRELANEDVNIVRQAITSIGDISVNPVETIAIIELRIPERLADLLLSDDPYLRERVAMIYEMLGRQAAGREAILKYPKILYHLSKGLEDPLVAVRTKMAQVIEIISRDAIAAERLCKYGFLDILVDRIDSEKAETILAVILESVECLLDTSSEYSKKRAIEIKTMEKIVSLLQNNNEEKILAGGLSCLTILFQGPIAKQKSIEMTLLLLLEKFLNDSRVMVQRKAVGAVAFATITTPGRLQAIELQIMGRLVKFAANSSDRELQLNSMKALSNITEVPKGKLMLLKVHSRFIEDIDTSHDEAIAKHKNILLKIIHSRP